MGIMNGFVVHKLGIHSQHMAVKKIVLTCFTEKMIETYWSSHFDWQPPIDQPFLRSHGLSKPFETVWWISNYQLKPSIGRGRCSLDLKMHKWASCQWSKDGLIGRMRINGAFQTTFALLDICSWTYLAEIQKEGYHIALTTFDIIWLLIYPGQKHASASTVLQNPLSFYYNV